MAVEQVDERLPDRFALLTRGRRTASPRHQTLRSLIVECAARAVKALSTRIADRITQVVRLCQTVSMYRLVQDAGAVRHLPTSSDAG